MTRDPVLSDRVPDSDGLLSYVHRELIPVVRSLLRRVGSLETLATGTIVPPVSLAFKKTAGAVDAVGYAVPANPGGANRFSLYRVRCRLDLAIVGTGTVVIRAGTTVGGNELLLDSAAWGSGTPVGTEIGIAVAGLGASFPAANNYVCELASGASVNVRATTTGAISAGAIKIFTYGVPVS